MTAFRHNLNESKLCPWRHLGCFSVPCQCRRCVVALNVQENDNTYKELVQT